MPHAPARTLRGALILTDILLGAVSQSGAQAIRYPAARIADVADDYHGTTVHDPYRWLEDPDSAETRRWIEEQNRLTAAYLAQISERAQILQRLTKLWNYPKYGAPFRKGGLYFFFKNDGLQNQAVLYTVTSLEAQPQMILDPNTLSPDGTVAVSLVGLGPAQIIDPAEMGWRELVGAAVGDLGSFQLAVCLQNHTQLSIGGGVAGMRHGRIVCFLNLLTNRRKELLKVQLRERRERFCGEGDVRTAQKQNRQPQNDKSPGGRPPPESPSGIGGPQGCAVQIGRSPERT